MDLVRSFSVLLSQFQCLALLARCNRAKLMVFAGIVEIRHVVSTEGEAHESAANRIVGRQEAILCSAVVEEQVKRTIWRSL